ncbi:MAG TPA: hypothetical protein VFE31_09820 [Opitutaceae bacterium]|jgi:hypothetical protein|nr:hypothetical protein [Opitutaceae bacterium]
MARKPWPMRWIVIAIIVFIVPYTYLTLRYRKPTSFEPYEDARERGRIASAGYSRITLTVRRVPESPGRAPAPDIAGVASAPGGLPADLARELLQAPVLPQDIGAVAAAPAGDAAHDYRVRFDCVLPRRPELWSVGSAHLYHKGRNLYLVVGFAPLADGLVQRMPEDRLALGIPLASLDPGSYRVTLIGVRSSKTWMLQVH